MNKVLASFVAFIASLLISNLHAQNPVTANVKAVVVNDSTYTLKANIQIQDNWHVYAANPDGLNAPEFKAGLETVQFIGAPVYSMKASKQRDVLFKEANVYLHTLDVEQNIFIKGFQPDSLKTIVVLNAAKGDQFLALEIPVSVALANGKKRVDCTHYTLGISNDSSNRFFFSQKIQDQKARYTKWFIVWSEHFSNLCIGQCAFSCDWQCTTRNF